MAEKVTGQTSEMPRGHNQDNNINNKTIIMTMTTHALNYKNVTSQIPTTMILTQAYKQNGRCLLLGLEPWPSLPPFAPQNKWNSFRLWAEQSRNEFLKTKQSYPAYVKYFQ